MTDAASGAAEPLLVLWDVDGTLINNGGVSKEAYGAAFLTLAGRPTSEPVITDGQTDPAILRSLLTRNGLKVTPDLLLRGLAVLPGALAGLSERLAERGHAKPGAREAIDALGKQRGLVQSVLTGNIQPNALIKLRAFGLHHGLDLDIGGYGSDSEVRAELVGAAVRKATAKYGLPFRAVDTVLIGDTPRDVEAGLLSGAAVVGVATGEYNMEQLAAAGAHVVLAGLTDTAAVVAAVLGARVG